MKSKMTTPAPAEDLYRSDLFTKARRYARTFDAWYILSARHDLLRPTDVIAPYDEALGDKRTGPPIDQWALRCLDGLAAAQFGHIAAAGRVHVTFLAGWHYREPLSGYLLGSDWCAGVSEPLAHLGIGQQKAWLREAMLPYAGLLPGP